jgi:hypothetical protein
VKVQFGGGSPRAGELEFVEDAEFHEVASRVARFPWLFVTEFHGGTAVGNRGRDEKPAGVARDAGGAAWHDRGSEWHGQARQGEALGHDQW